MRTRLIVALAGIAVGTAVLVVVAAPAAAQQPAGQQPAGQQQAPPGPGQQSSPQQQAVQPGQGQQSPQTPGAGQAPPPSRSRQPLPPWAVKPGQQPASPLGGLRPLPPSGATSPGSMQQSGFLPVNQLPQQEKLPAAPLVIGAYAFVWAALLAYVWTIWRRLGKVETDMRDLSARLTSKAGRGRGARG